MDIINTISNLIILALDILLNWVPSILDFFFNWSGNGLGLIPFIFTNFLLVIMIIEILILAFAMEQPTIAQMLVTIVELNITAGTFLLEITIGIFKFIFRLVNAINPIG